jgi:hypothetical protein
VFVEASSFSTEAMASRRDVRTSLSCFGLLIAELLLSAAHYFTAGLELFDGCCDVFRDV